jgi:tetratricopeptide (TPR) repeat protein
MGAASCSRAPEQQYAPARAEYLHGNLPEVIREASLGIGQHPDQNSALYWQFRLLKAEALLDQGKASEALPLLGQPVPATFGQLEVRRLIDMALAHRTEPKVAWPLLEQAQAKVTDEELRLQILQLQGSVASVDGRRDEAEAKVREALALAQKSGADYYAARSLLSLGYFQKTKNRYSDGIDLNEQALSIARRIGAAKITAGALLNLGYLYAFFGDFDRGVKSEKEAVEISSRIGDEPRYVNAAGELALVLNMRGDTKEAIVWEKKAFDLAKRDGSAADASRMAANLAVSYLDLSDWDQAEHWNRLATPRTPNIAMNEADIALGRGQYDRFFQLCDEVIRTAKTTALEWQVHGDMAGAYEERSDYKNAFLEYKRALAVYEKARAQLPAGDIRRVTMLPRLIRTYQEYVEALIRDKKPDEALQLVESSRARVLEERFGEDNRRRARPSGHAQSGAAGALLLSFWIAPHHSYLWLFSGSGNRLFDLPGEKEIMDAVTDYKRLTETEKKNPLSLTGDAASPLWGMLLEKAAQDIPPGSRVVVIPDGPLHQVNLETLVVPGPHPHYWLKDVELVVAPSRALAPSFAGPLTGSVAGNSLDGKKMLLIGAADYRGTSYPTLRYAMEELSDIQAKLPNMHAAVYEKEKATPQAYLDSQPEQFAIIHFAAHAESNQESPLESAVILSRSGPGAGSGSGEGYRLYAQNIFKIPIQADLVTISACRSAGAKAFAGEGLIGFAWAFLASGARNVIGGLWDVDDESTAQLMSDLYAGIAAGDDPVRALHQAKLKLIQNYPKPYYWGPLQIYSASK